jgi:hypothetical protein
MRFVANARIRVSAAVELTLILRKVMAVDYDRQAFVVNGR